MGKKNRKNHSPGTPPSPGQLKDSTSPGKKEALPPGKNARPSSAAADSGKPLNASSAFAAQESPRGENRQAGKSAGKIGKNVSPTQKESSSAETVSHRPPLKGLPVRKKAEKLTGARQSKVNPKVQTLLQHEQHKRNIVKIFLIVTAVMTVLFLIYFLQDQFARTGRHNKAIQARLAKLEENERRMFSVNGYEQERAARDGIRLAEAVLALDYRGQIAEMEKKIKQYNEILETSFPVLAAPGEEGSGFIAKSAMLDMVHIPAGEFYMGQRQNEPGGLNEDELPRRKITIANQFWIARTEVSVWQMRKLIPGYKMELWGGYTLDGLSQPAGSVKWHTAALFCQKLTELERAAGRIPEHYEYRLPSEAEWEYACRAGTESTYYWGNSFGNEGAVYANSLDKRSALKFGWQEGPDMAQNDRHYVSAPAGSYKPNAFGLYDMSGNLWEWCYDWYDPNAYKDHITPRKSPVQLRPVSVAYTQYRPFDASTYDIETPCKVIRGGSWGNLPEDLRSAKRDFMPPEQANTGVGFRPVLAPVIPTKTRN